MTVESIIEATDRITDNWRRLDGMRKAQVVGGLVLGTVILGTVIGDASKPGAFYLDGGASRATFEINPSGEPEGSIPTIDTPVVITGE